MDFHTFSSRNLAALEATRHRAFPLDDVERCNYALGYRGFVNCVATHDTDSFMMFTNADDVVAGHYMYSGPASFETGTLQLWTHLARQSSWVYDVGAFTGVFSLAAIAANPHCRVMAFEPSFVTYARLLVNIAANDFNGHIAPVRAGLGAELAELELQHPSGVYVMSSNETFVAQNIADPWFSEKVQVVSLDHLLAHQDRYRKQLVIDTHFGGVDLVKIDVESFETEVVKGMAETIAAQKPAVIIEILDENHKILNTEVLEARFREMLALFGPGYQIKHIAEADGKFTQTVQGRNNLFIHEDKLHLLDNYTGCP